MRVSVGEELQAVLSTLALDQMFLGGRPDGLMRTNTIELVTIAPLYTQRQPSPYTRTGALAGGEHTRSLTKTSIHEGPNEL